MEGIFCANFYWTLGGFQPCQGAWCGSCYTSEKNLHFHVSSQQIQTDKESHMKGRRREDVPNKWKQKEPNGRDFLEARNGDHALCPFECDTCIFRKLRGTSPKLSSSQDKLLLVMIRRMNLDAFWARARSTVNQNTRRINQTLGFSEALGLKGPFDHSGPYPFFDHCGYEIAACILMHSRRPGRHDSTHTQYETIRKLRSTYSSHIRSVPRANINHL